jgi:hypothetical protein
MTSGSGMAACVMHHAPLHVAPSLSRHRAERFSQCLCTAISISIAQKLAHSNQVRCVKFHRTDPRIMLTGGWDGVGSASALVTFSCVLFCAAFSVVRALL